MESPVQELAKVLFMARFKSDPDLLLYAWSQVNKEPYYRMAKAAIEYTQQGSTD